MKTDVGRNNISCPTAPMRDSGIEWIGEIPEGWDVNRLRFHATIKVSNVDKKTIEGEFPVRLCNYTDVYYQERITDDLEFMVATATASQKQQFALISGDVLLTKDSETAEDIGVSALVVGPLRNVVLGYHLALLRGYPDNLENRFLHWQLKATIAKDQLSLSATGVTRFGLRQESIASLQLILPPPTQQRAIADFLDHETSRIDTLIAKRQRIIGLLDEKRSALITQAVTRGLDPTAPMRDSGIEWIGEIPEGWKVAALKRLCSLSANYGLNVTGDDYRTSGVRLLRTSDIEESGLLKDEGDAVYVDPARATGMTLEHGDILLSRSGTLGRCLRFRDQGAACTFAAYLVRFRVSSDQLDNYVEYCSRAKFFSAQIEIDAIQSTIANFNGQKYGDINMPIPPLAEQRAIADFLDHETTRIDQLKSLNQRQIELLKEKRQALITAAVTGKIPEAKGVA